MMHDVDTSQKGDTAPLCRSEITDDDFLGGQLKVLQPVRGYRAGLDAVLLAAAVEANSDRRTRVLDVGAGVGTVGLCVARRLPFAEVVLFEREAALVDLARENITRNGLEGRVRACLGEVGARAGHYLEREGLKDGSFTHVLANPPFFDGGSATRSASKLRAAAHVMDGGDFEVWGRFLARMAGPAGQALVIHKADALAKVLAGLEGRFGRIRVLPIRPRPGENANRVIVSGIRGSKAPLSVLPGFVLHGDGNGFTPAAEAILREGRGLYPK
ncbi:Methyltransferase [Candidatus Filomicrobium marinum]|nr:MULTISPECIES: methyltransferase [Filomicrobium]CFX61691.1 Methyltransferase [Candidatus Filomicrobium marinum]